MHDLTGKHALVCGASAGIGRATAFALAARGATLSILARRRQRLDAMVDELRAAMAGWSKTLSRELPPGVTINNVLPGFTDTERLTSLKQQAAKNQGKQEDQVEAGWIAATPEGRLGRPEELGETIAFLASPAAAFIRGQSLAVDGGRLQSI